MTDKVETAEIENQEVLDETAAADSIKTKTVSISDMIKRMQGMSHDDITKLSEVINQFGANGAEASKGVDGGAAASNLKTISTKTIKEDLAAIFGDDSKELTEGFLDDTATLFESALSLRVAEIEEKMFEEAAEILESMIEEKMSEITEALDTYLEEAVDAWVNENELAIESSIKTAQHESFMEGLKTLFLEHDVEIPEESLDLVEELSGEVEDLKGQLNEALNKLIEKDKALEESTKEKAIDELVEGMVLTDAEKLRTLVEDIETSDIEDFKNKARVIKEHHFKKTSAPLTEEVEGEVISEEKKQESSDSMDRYRAAISESVKKQKI
jgi:hypothetical protein